MTRISDKTQVLMFERWRDSIPLHYRAGQKRRGHRHSVTGAIIVPTTADATAFWTEFVSARDWTE